MPEAKPGPVPELRFPEFRDAGPWEVKRLGELVETVTPPKKLQTSEYLPSGRFPIIDQSPSDVCGWTNDETAMVQADFPLVVFGDHSCVVKLANGPFAQGADGIKILAPTSEIEARFLFLSLQADPIEQKGYKRHFSTLKEKQIPFPRKDTGEQQKIADCLRSLDDLIRAEKRRLEALSAHKTGLMQCLFPAIGQTTPRLRFPEFEGAGPWEVKRLGDSEIARFIRERVAAEDVPLGHYVSTVNLLPAFCGLSPEPEKPPAGSAIAYREGDILMSNIRPYLQKVWVADRSGGASNDVLVVRPSKSVVKSFLSQLLMSERFISHVMGGAKGVKMPRGDLEQIQDFEVPLPARPEQQKIADCLTALDDLIRAQGETIEALKTHKRGLIQRLFPREVG
ncbi:Type I restriction modification DNA specificity domain protein [Jannaschia seosinensis]|uniref:Type I restriction modification DNA specificity domain protein n=1 Tax=Jannaschia seosinensis TaxID=313367 RepID=A0A0M7BFM1_9RHOB|nr:restriction endonuclease subunit S [Jannaschia seosinensis]CUH40175.1 Type I restriction modification DNA specificity domain protein [Jannaschia seosinensis]